jgi:CubicO group peptidase (beta-lactamase class C family)
MKRRSLLITAFTLLSLVFTQFACTSVQQKKQDQLAGLSADSMELIPKTLQTYIDSGKLAGISALVFKDSQVVYRQNFGMSDIGKKIPVDDKTIFRIFSMSKPITSVALMTLFDEGKFALDDPVAKYIPEFANTLVYNIETGKTEPQKQPLTIRNLLTHTSGITYGWDLKAYVDSVYRATKVIGWDGVLADKIKLLATLPLKSQPGTKYEYSYSIDVAGYLVEVLSVVPFDVYLKTKIFDPLKMDDTGFFVPDEKRNRFAGVYSVKDGKLVLNEQMGEAFKPSVTMFSGGGGLVSTLDDYLTFCKMLLNGGELNGVRIISEKAVGLISSNQLPEGVKYADGKGYGLAVDVNLATGEYGWAGAAATKFWIDPQNRMILIFGTQLMPADYSYADNFHKLVRSALPK